jgi:hypothetical protein
MENLETPEKKKRIDREPPLFDQLAYSINQVARLTSLSRNSVILEMQDGKLPFIKRRGRKLILADVVKKYLAEEPSNDSER